MVATERLVLTVEKSKLPAFLQMLELLDFVKGESNDAFFRRFIQNVPKEVPLSEEEIAAEVMEMRYGDF
jgi:hypothetical protein